jgi:signal transduction histidine kinase
MVLPLVTKGRVIGVMSAQSDQPRAFDVEHRRIFSGIANQVAIAVENARLYQAMARRARDLRRLADASASMIGALAPQEILDHLMAALTERFSASCAISLVDLGDEYLTLAAAWMPDDQPYPLPIGYRMRLAERPGLRDLVISQQRLYTADVAQSPWWEMTSERERELMQQVGIKALLILPMLSLDRMVGVVSLRFREPLSEPVDEQLDWTQTLVNQAAVALASARLYQQLERQAEELSQAYSELQEINQLRTELVQNVGHELRTPLALIKGYADLLHQESLGSPTEEQSDALKVILARTSALEGLIHNLTMLQRVPREALTLEPVQLVAVVQQAWAGFQGAAEAAGVTLVESWSPDLPAVWGDQRRLELAFSHLIDNAIKFSPDGGALTIEGWYDSEYVYVSVADEGIGIATVHLSRIFDRFYQVDGSTRRRFGGMGVGLALVWEIIEVHGGAVTVDSEPGQGSTFTITLPRFKGEE